MMGAWYCTADIRWEEDSFVLLWRLGGTIVFVVRRVSGARLSLSVRAYAGSMLETDDEGIGRSQGEAVLPGDAKLEG